MQRDESRGIVTRVTTFAGETVLLHGRGRRYEAHSEAGAFSLKMVRRGAASWRAGSRAVTLRESTFLFLPPETAYTVTIDAESTAETACLFFPSEMLATVASAGRAEVALDDTRAGAPNGWHLRASAADALALDRLVRLVVDAVPLRPEQVEEILIADVPPLFAASFGASAPGRLHAVRASTRDELRRRALVGRDFLVDHLTEEVSLRAAARAAGLSAFHFHRTFRALFGVPPLRYVAERRLERAAFLLLHSPLPVTDVCYRCGYESLGSFGRAFVRRFGTSPGRFRYDRN